MPVVPCLVSGILLGYFFTYFPVITIIFSILLIFAFKNNKLIAILLFISMLFGILYISITYCKDTVEPENISFTGYLKNKSGNIYEFKVSCSSDTKKTILKLYSNEPLQEGQTYKIQCIIGKKHLNPYQYGEPLCFLKTAQLEENFQKTAVDKIREKINKKIAETINKELSGTLIAMTTGERTSIPIEIQEDFRKTGLIHLLSISGAHFSLLFTVCFLIFKFLIKRLPYTVLLKITLYWKPSQLATFFTFPVILCYFLIVEPNYPTSRSFIMATLFMIGALSERKSLWIFTVSFACLIILIFQPQAIKDISFQLSFLATAGIGFASDIYKKFKDKIPKKISYLLLSLFISISATVITAPLIVYRFHYLSLISPLANLTVGVLIGMVLFPLHLFFVVVFLITGYYPLPEVIDFIGKFSFKIMHTLASFKYSSIWIPLIPPMALAIFYMAVFITLFGFYCLKKKKTLILGFSMILVLTSILIPFFMHIKDKESLKITFLDVGQAESVVLKTPSGFFLIDTGKTGWEATQFLKAYDVKELILIITHEQKDHAGGFERILENFQIKEIWDTGYINYSKEPANDILIRHLERGDVLKVGSCSFTVLHPYKGFWSPSLSRDSNEVSLIFKFQCFKKTFLFTSDAGIDALQTIPVNYLKSEVVKIPHHGSKRSFYPEFYKVTEPEICIISAGKQNPYGHPHKEVVENINKICKIYRTDEDGAIQIKELPDGSLRVQTFKNAVFKPYEDWENLKKLFILW
ncbi:DNA internalization-related competence protein ComEC/Rec2 [Thermodesulfovibrio sp. 3462-1]|uniref:DNA internalization-related competence protein ComEC/Rec2 n=1 Tax=Thermodesulfovibrio obliviosus TaxID=3118332 RepID=A0AAU8H4F3_9BACT